MPSETDEHDHDHHHDEPELSPYRKNLLIATNSLQKLIEDGELESGIVEIGTRAELNDRVGIGEDFTDEDFNALTGRDTGTRTRWLYDVGDPARDPIEDAKRVVAADKRIKASPILATMFSVHITVMPGTTPRHVTSPPELDDEVIDAPIDAPIAVVDSGYNPRETPTWLADRVQAVDPALDADEWDPTSGWRGHGTFVASIIVQQNPHASVWIAALKPLAKDQFLHWIEVKDAEKNKPLVYSLADEFSLYSAVRRLLDSPGVPSRYRALNLSLGAWTSKTTPLSGLAIRMAVDLWQSRQPNVPIVAAAGNHSLDEDPGEDPDAGNLFIPGQWTDIEGLFGVQSVDKNGKRSFFSNEASTSAIGEALLGLRDEDKNADWKPVHWSGTSFATAVVSAHVARTNPPKAPPAVVPLESRLHSKLGVPPPTKNNPKG